MRSTCLFIVVMLAAALSSGCSEKEPQRTIDPAKTEQIDRKLESGSSAAGLRIAVGG